MLMGSRVVLIEQFYVKKKLRTQKRLILVNNVS
jgi:hypothetical protein